MLMHRSIRNFNFPPVEIELLKISSSNSNPRSQNYVQMPKFIFFFEKGKLGQLTGILLSSVTGEWEILTLRGWGGEFEPEM